MKYLKSTISRYSQACYTELNDEVIILNPDNETLYHFNMSAAELWKSLETPKKILQLIEILEQKYHGTLEDYKSDVLEWVGDTHQKGLLTITDNNTDVAINT
jgi:hypothetical protein